MSLCHYHHHHSHTWTDDVDDDDDDGDDDDDEDDDLVLQGKDAVPPVTPSTVDPGEPSFWQMFHNRGRNIA